ncbi:hypothetical protein PHYBOEH_001150 [Phytophthora boehmeriae]|uniref:RxLR effector protein n=1 Tax=Phytophthora boehmeriae TaxID=109152 RepID=A0A8T1VAE5_9STRA|nr:hypothetical protein PHYBOEH_001150 [Phytophthora boehmeriae]
MHLYSYVLVALVTILVTCETFALSSVLTVAPDDTPTSDRTRTAVSIDVDGKRYLRTTKTADDNDEHNLTGVDDSTISADTTERAGASPSMLTRAKDRVKAKWWAETKASDDYVKNKLRLTGKSEEILKNHKTYQRYLYTTERIEFSKWVAQKPPLPTFDAWRYLGLNKMVLQGKSLKEIKKTAEFKSYEHYVRMFDQGISADWKVGYKTEHMIPRYATPVEMTAKAELWAANGMPDKYVLYALNLNKLPHSERVTVEDYQYFLIFKNAQQAMS